MTKFSVLDPPVVCLDIPVPECIRDLLKDTPICLPIQEDIDVLDRIRKFGEKYGRLEAEINQACNLASGLSDIIIILERPSNTHNYALPFDDFVRDCATLKAVDELIRFSSKGSRSIHTVTVLDAYSYSTKGDKSIPPGCCHQLISDIIHLKKPKVIIGSWRGICDDGLISRLRGGDFTIWPLRDTIREGPLVFTKYHSFHPSTAVNHRSRFPFTRMLLICHYVLAFAELSGYQEHEHWIRVLGKETASEENDNRTGGPRYTEMITDALWLITGHPKLNPRTSIPNPMNASHWNSTWDEMYELLLASEYSLGAARIARLCLHWKKEGTDVDAKVLEKLYELGSRQSVVDIDFPISRKINIR